MYGSMSTLSAVRQRSVFLERATEEMEALRAIPWGQTGVASSDPNKGTAYPGGTFEGRSAIVAAGGPSAVTVHADREPYTVRRWVTVGPDGAGANKPRRLDVAVEWHEEGVLRTIRLSSVRYPGGLGADNGVNATPVVTATATPSSAVAGVTTVQLSASGSDADGDTLTYAWDLGDGTTATGASPTHVYATSGAFTATVTASDGKGASAVAPVDVVVATPGSNRPPVAVLQATTATTGTAPFSVSFDSAGSSDPDGDALTYRWIWGDSTPDGAGVSATHVFTGAATFTVTLVVSDSAGATGSATTVVQTNPLNCDVTDGYFQNPLGTIKNVIDLVGNSGAPTNRSFTFRATSNTACTTLNARIPHAGGTFVAPLTVVATSGGTRTWETTASVATSVEFSVGSYQSGQFVGTGPAGQTDQIPLSFAVVKKL
jgi:PKD repeat protein